MRNLLILLLPLLICCRDHKYQKTGLEGTDLPDFTILMIDSTTMVNPKKTSNGKPVVLFYLSPTCPYCKAQTRGIVNKINLMRDVQFYLVGSSQFKEMKNFYNKFQLYKYENIRMGLDTTAFMQAYYNAQLVPYTAIYRKDGKMSKAYMGIIDVSTLRKAISE